MHTECASLQEQVMHRDCASLMHTGMGMIANRNALQLALEFASNSKDKQSKDIERKRSSKKTVVKRVTKKNHNARTATQDPEFDYILNEETKTMIRIPRKPGS